MHVEAFWVDNFWAVQNAGELAGKNITYPLPGMAPEGYSSHANAVASFLAGSSTSILPSLTNYFSAEAATYRSFSLNLGKFWAPATPTWDIENHSYIGSSGAYDTQALQRMDWRVDNQGTTIVVALENGTNLMNALYGNVYNPIVVGSSSGVHTRGGTRMEVSGRIKPDLVGTNTWCSYATPIVSSCAGLLIADAKLNSPTATNPRVIKSILMAGATKEEFPGWTNTATEPLDLVYGAGEVNIRNSWRILKSGQQAASAGSYRSTSGWDLGNTSVTRTYFIQVPTGQTLSLSAVLTWHRTITPSSNWITYTTNLPNLSLKLHRASGFNFTSTVATSDSAKDNVEHIYELDLSAGDYALEVSGPTGTTYGLAWRGQLNGTSTQPQTPPSITSQPSSITVTAGQTASFSVSASGSTPMTYQWRKNGTDIAGATAATYIIGSTTSADAATYYVVVSNAAGVATSASATLTVNPAPVAPTITSQPQSVTVTAGQSATFSVSANGTAPFTYQWRKNGTNIAGATSSNYTIAVTSSADAANYSAVISNAAGSATTWNSVLTVNPAPVAPTITSQPTSQSINQGQAATFSVSANGTGTLSYQWSKNGWEIWGATSSTYTIASANTSDNGSYTVRVTNTLGSANSTAATLTVSSAPVVAPTIISQPQSVTVTAGQTATFPVSVTGTAPFTYQWRKNGVNISGATSSTYTIAVTSSADAGLYSAVISNSAGSATTWNSVLTVNPAPTAPSITSQPASLTLTAGQSASFSVSANGTAPFTYQWRKNGVNISGATSASYSISTTATTDSANYSVVVTNSVGSATSSSAVLTVNAAPVAPTIISQPQSVTVTAGQSATFSVSANGTAPFTYQWRKNGVNISGATSSTYTIAVTSTADAGLYSAVISNSAGSATTWNSVLTVNAASTAPSITSQPASLTLTAGQSATFSVSANGTAPFTYQWRKNGVNISGATSASYSISTTATTDSANYSVVVTNSVGSATSSSAVLTVNAAPVAPSITSQPASLTLTAGQSATFSVSVNGTAPFTYQWRKNGVTISDATSASYTISSTATTDSANYSVVVTNSVGSATSSSAVLTVNAAPVAPTIISQPQSVTVTAGQSATFSVSANGTSTLSYQWRKNGVNISGATSASYSIASTATTDSANYSVVVTNSVGSATSSSAVLTVNAAPVAPTITSQPASLTLTTGQSATFWVSANGTAPLTYQWRKNGVNISGATSASYSISTTATTDSANYSVVVTNSVGSATSSSAVLTVNIPALVITAHPSSATINVGQVAVLAATATSTAPISYQWYKNGAQIADATSATYIIYDASTADTATYHVAISNGFTTLNSTSATITVNQPILTPSITGQPSSRSVNAGQPATFSVSASGVGPLSYQWNKNGTPISGANYISYSIASASTSDAGSYSVTVSNAGGSTTSTSAELTVTSAPVVPITITTQPNSARYNPGAFGVISIIASSTGPVSYQWYKDGVAIPGANFSAIVFFSTTTNDSGSYHVCAYNETTSTNSTVATITVGQPDVVAPTIVSQPSSVSLTEGQPANFAVTATGSGALSYQWYKNGVAISGATNSSYYIFSASSAHAGSYSVRVAGGTSSVLSSQASLTVMVVQPPTPPPQPPEQPPEQPPQPPQPPQQPPEQPPQPPTVIRFAPSIVSHPSSVTIDQAQTLSLSVAAEGSTDMTYQWYKNGSAIFGATSTQYIVGSTSTTDSGNYHVVVTNSVGSATSNIAVVQVRTIQQPPPPVDFLPVITSEPVSITVRSRFSGSISVSATSSTPLTYQWYRNGSAISGATGATYRISRASSANSGSYYVVVSNAEGSVTSATATITVR